MTAVLSTAQDAFFDVLKTVPLLLLVYALLYYIENRLTDTPALLSRTAQFGPAVGALAGSIPQCGFSAAASALFSAGYLAPATLVAVFLATSDEAVPVMLAGGASAKTSSRCSSSSSFLPHSAAICCAVPCSAGAR